MGDTDRAIIHPTPGAEYTQENGCCMSHTSWLQQACSWRTSIKQSWWPHIDRGSDALKIGVTSPPSRDWRAYR